MKRLNFSQLTTDRSSGIVNYQLNLCKRTKAWTAEEEAACMTRIAAHEPGYEKDVETLVVQNLGLAVSVAKQYTGRGLDLEDLVQEANLGLVLAAYNADPAGCRFFNYAIFWMRRELHRAISAYGYGTRLPQRAYQNYLSFNQMRNFMTVALGYEPDFDEVMEALKLERNVNADDIKQMMAATQEWDHPEEEQADSHQGFENINRMDILTILQEELGEKKAEFLMDFFGFNPECDTEEKACKRHGYSLSYGRRIANNCCALLSQCKNAKELKALLA